MAGLVGTLAGYLGWRLAVVLDESLGWRWPKGRQSCCKRRGRRLLFETLEPRIMLSSLPTPYSNFDVGGPAISGITACVQTSSQYQIIAAGTGLTSGDPSQMGMAVGGAGFLIVSQFVPVVDVAGDVSKGVELTEDVAAAAVQTTGLASDATVAVRAAEVASGATPVVQNVAPAAEGESNVFTLHQWGNPDTIPCFPAEALVHTPTGVKAIARLIPGDEVLSFDEKSRRVVTRRIRAVLKNWTDMLVKLQVGGEIIWATKIHPFYLPDDGKWIPSCDLRAGMRLLDKDMQPRTIDHVEHMATLEDTFNIEIEECHTYFVGEAGVLVHNESIFANTEKAITQIYGVIENVTQKVVYVGRTTRSIETRFAEEEWGDGYHAIRLERGNWTSYEAAVWEQHYIDANGGKAVLQNVNNAITEAKYAKFKPLHNPC